MDARSAILRDRRRCLRQVLELMILVARGAVHGGRGLVPRHKVAVLPVGFTARPRVSAEVVHGRELGRR
jgi:hypothetical protein